MFRLLILACVLARATTASAQAVEVTPFAGYRFGGDFFELLTRQRVDLDGAPAVGVVVDVPLRDGTHLEGFFTHQNAHVSVRTDPYGATDRWQISVAHWQIGGLQEVGRGRARPFFNATVGLTRYAAEGDGEVRFAAAGGGGVKLLFSRHLGVRLGGNVFATFVETSGAIACSPNVCLIGINANIAWQAEFTAGLVVRFP